MLSVMISAVVPVMTRPVCALSARNRKARPLTGSSSLAGGREAQHRQGVNQPALGLFHAIPGGPVLRQTQRRNDLGEPAGFAQAVQVVLRQHPVADVVHRVVPAHPVRCASPSATARCHSPSGAGTSALMVRKSLRYPSAWPQASQRTFSKYTRWPQWSQWKFCMSVCRCIQTQNGPAGPLCFRIVAQATQVLGSPRSLTLTVGPGGAVIWTWCSRPRKV